MKRYLYLKLPHLSMKLIEAIVRAFPNTEYKSDVFPGLVFKLKKPKTATLIFQAGRMVCTGAKSEKHASIFTLS